jgi:hypothetical protein
MRLGVLEPCHGPPESLTRVAEEHRPGGYNVKLLLRQGSVPHDEVQQVLRVVFKLP